MKKYLLIVILIAAIYTVNAQRPRVELQGIWHTSLGDCQLPGTTDENKLGDEIHPTNVTFQLTRLFPYSGKVYYAKDVIIPTSMSDKRLALVMERTKPSTLWIDGDSIGSIGHIYAPHIYKLPRLTVGKHTISIQVDNSDTAVPRLKRNHKLGLVFEFAVGRGKLLVCMFDLSAAAEYIEGKAFHNSLYRYIQSPDFNPRNI